MKLLFAILFICSMVAYGQLSPTTAVSPRPAVVGLTWSPDTTGVIDSYIVLYIQAQDTSLFETANFVNGATYSQVWMWAIGSSLYEYFYLPLKTYLFPTISYVRLGVIGVKNDGDFTPLECISKVITIKPNVKVKNVKVN